MDPKFSRDVIRFMVLAFGCGLMVYALAEVISKQMKEEPKRLEGWNEWPNNVVPFKKTIH